MPRRSVERHDSTRKKGAVVCESISVMKLHCYIKLIINGKYSFLGGKAEAFLERYAALRSAGCARARDERLGLFGGCKDDLFL